MSKKIYKYLIILLLTFAFTYVFELKELYMLLYILFLLPLVDILSLKLYLSKVNSKIIINDFSCTRGDTIEFGVFIQNNNIFQVNNLLVTISFEGCINNNEIFIKNICLEGKKHLVLKRYIEASHIGVGIIKLQTICVKGLFGLFKKDIIINKEKEINIKPKNIDIKGCKKLLHNSNYNNFGNNEFAGELDLEYKDYEPGESVRKINWKISSKRQKLLMRKNIQNSKKETIVFILDSYINKNNLYYKNRDKLIESFISIVSYFNKDKFEVKVYIYSFNGYIKSEIINKELFVNYDFELLKDDFKNLEFNDYNNYVIVTSRINNKNESVIKKFIKFNKSHLKIVCTNEYKKKQEGFKFCEIFYIDDNNNIN